MLFFSDVKQYIPVKFPDVQSGRKYSFISDIWTANLKPNHFRKKPHMGCYQDGMGRSLLTLNGAIVQLSISVKIPLRDKYRLRHMISKRPLLLHVMLRWGTSWYALDNIEYLLPPHPHLEESEL